MWLLGFLFAFPCTHHLISCWFYMEAIATGHIFQLFPGDVLANGCVLLSEAPQNVVPFTLLSTPINKAFPKTGRPKWPWVKHRVTPTIGSHGLISTHMCSVGNETFWDSRIKPPVGWVFGGVRLYCLGPLHLLHRSHVFLINPC